jgi:dienelactone hydrolase
MNRPHEAERPVAIELGDVRLNGDLCVPSGAPGVVLFAHGSGSGRRSPRNRFVARHLQGAGLATLLLDLLTEREEAADRAGGGRWRFDIGLLAGRLVAVTDWLAGLEPTAPPPVGYFGASTGGGAALVAAAERPGRVAAVVSRGGRPDLAGEALGRVRAPTLFVVGGRDADVLALNREAMRHVRAERRLDVVAGATHLFEEAGALEVVAALAADWFSRHLAPAPARRPPAGPGGPLRAPPAPRANAPARPYVAPRERGGAVRRTCGRQQPKWRRRRPWRAR